MSAADPIGLTSVAHNQTLTGDGTTASPLSVVGGQAPVRAIGAARNELIVLINNDGTTITLVDMPVVAWLVDESGVPAVPVINWAITPLWARVEFETDHLVPGLVGAAIVVVTMCDDSFRGGFSEFLDWLQTTTGKSVSSTQLVTGHLISAYWSWVSDTHGGRTF
jgi:hypothetical protein